MKTFKAKRCDWREDVMKAMGLNYYILNDMIVYKGDIGENKTLVNMLVDKGIELGILPK